MERLLHHYKANIKNAQNSNEDAIFFESYFVSKKNWISKCNLHVLWITTMVNTYVPTLYMFFNMLFCKYKICLETIIGIILKFNQNSITSYIYAYFQLCNNYEQTQFLISMEKN